MKGGPTDPPNRLGEQWVLLRKKCFNEGGAY